MHSPIRQVSLCGAVVLGCAGEGATGPSLERLEIRLIPTTATLLVNDTVQASVVGFDEAGHSYPAGPVSWASTAPTIAGVDTAGVVTALRPGSVTLVAIVGHVVDSLALAVAGTRHRWPIGTSEVWTLAGAPHAVSGRLTVGGLGGASATLEIEAGTAVEFADTSGLTFGEGGAGSLRVLGTAAAPVAFRAAGGSSTPGTWIGLTFRGRTLSELHHVTVSGCGASRADDQPRGCLVLGHRYEAAGPALLVEDVAVTDAAAGALFLQAESHFAPGSTGLSASNIRGHVATLPAAAVAAFPQGGTFAAVDTNEIWIVGDTMRESATWTSPGPRFTVLGPVVIEGPEQPVLTIPAGGTLRFSSSDAGFVVGNSAPGGLRIGTTGGETVTLGTTTAGAWAGIAFMPFALPSSIRNAVLEDCGGSGVSPYGGGCVDLIGNFSGSAPAPVLENVTIRRAIQMGVAAVGGGRFGPGSNNLVITETRGSIGTPFWFYMSSPASLPPGTYTGNDGDFVRVYAVDITQSETWPNPGIPYLLTTGISVAASTSPVLTLAPGVELRFAPGAQVSVGGLATGAFQAVGTDAAPIVLRGQYEFPGAWMGVSLGPLASAATVLDHVIVDYAGADDGHVATAIRIARDYGEIIRHTLIRRSGGCGITRLSGASWSTDFTAPQLGNTFDSNSGPDQCGP